MKTLMDFSPLSVAHMSVIFRGVVILHFKQNSPESERSVFREKECEFSIACETKQSQLRQGCSAVSTGTYDPNN